MNKEYTYIDGKVIISDENDKKTQSEYYDNLDKVLIQENLIETMEGKIQELESESEFYKKNNRMSYIPVIFPMAVFMSTIGVPLMANWLTGENLFAISVDTIFGPMSQAMSISIPMSICIIPLGLAIELFTHSEYKSSIKKEKGINSQLTFLKQQIEKERDELERLKQDKSKANESTEFRTVKVDDLQQLKVLRDYLNLYFDLGYNGEKYYQFYQQGRLDRKLQKYYSDTGIQMAKDYLEEKGPSLVLRKKNSNNRNNSQK